MSQYVQLKPSDDELQNTIESLQPIQIFDLENERSPSIKPITSPGKQYFDALRQFPVPSTLSKLHMRYLAVKKLLNTGNPASAWASFSGLYREAELHGCEYQSTSRLDQTN
jgi:hypothetical protein